MKQYLLLTISLALRAHLETISPLNHVDKIRIPMFFGQNDPRVPVSKAVQIVAALREHLLNKFWSKLGDLESGEM